MNEKDLWIWFALGCGAGSKHMRPLLVTLGTVRAVYEASEAELLSAGAPHKLAAALAEKDLSEAGHICRYCRANRVTVLTMEDEAYPKMLLSLPDPPAVLYCLGRVPDWNHDLCVSVVGTRKMTEYGREMAYNIGAGLAYGGAVLVSGMALGIDGTAMKGALDQRGTTVAVLGCGIDVVYPKAHEKLERHILRRGAVITEYAPGERPVGAHFPVRNRIISGLSQATVVIEADAISGALITARHAETQGRDVFAVPGKVGDPNAEGPNELIKKGAHPATNAEDILREYEFLYPTRINAEKLRKLMPNGIGFYRKKHPFAAMKAAKAASASPQAAPRKETPAARPQAVNTEALSDGERRVFSMMKAGVPILADTLCASGLPITEVLTALTMLEIHGLVESLPGGQFVRRP